MTIEQLIEMGLDSEKATEVYELISRLEAEKTALEEELEGVRGEMLRKDEEQLYIFQEMALERAILEAGGKNAKAIMALLGKECVCFNGKDVAQLDLSQVLAEAPYLFHVKEDKFGGTGFQGSVKKDNDIGKAFKRALRR